MRKCDPASTAQVRAAQRFLRKLSDTGCSRIDRDKLRPEIDELEWELREVGREPDLHGKPED